MVALILEVAQSKPKPQGRLETIEMLERMRQEGEIEQAAWVTLTIFLWVLVIAFLAAIVFRCVM